MSADLTTVLPGLRNYSRVYLPSYDGSGILNLSNSILKRFGARSFGKTLKDDSVLSKKKVAVIVVDGLGYRQLHEVAQTLQPVTQALSKSSVDSCITTVFPSTTSTVLTTLNTALSPAQHGVIGFSMYVKELGCVVNNISFSPISEKWEGGFEAAGLEPGYLYPKRTIYNSLWESGVHSRSINPSNLANTVLSRMLYGGAEKFRYSQLSDMMVTLRRFLTDKVYEQEFIMAYWSGVDTIAHKYGPTSDEYKAEVHGFFSMLNSQVLDRISDRETAVIITADHGHADIPEGNFHDLSQDSELLNTLFVPPTGDSRAVFLYPKSDADVLHARFTGTSEVLKRQEITKNGFLGEEEITEKLAQRIGDYVALPFEKHSYVYRYPTFDFKPMRGNHGGLSLDELLIPLLAFEL
jgi:predicted AlkP superfamily pyrophosphatase or phosphodiesterase